MTRALDKRWQTIALALAAGALAGCSALDTGRKVIEDTELLRKGPRQAPQQTITSFSPALRCMDSLFYTYGVRDVGVLVEDLTDHTKKVNAGSKDILISAISQMTIRSKAVKLVVYGSDSGNLIGLLRESQRKHPYTVLPEFDIKGSISQLDENIARRQTDAGFSFSNKFSAGASKSASTNMLAVDLSVLSTNDLSVVPGVTSRNSVVIFKDGAGVDGEAQIKKFGINFNLSLAQSEGQTQALRTLLELAAIELLGKLTKVPYWTCLGSNAKDSSVKTEISDWFSSMLTDRSDLVRYFQNQMRVRGLYRGAVDGTPTAELADAIAEYRARLGLQKNFKVDLEFFTAYLNAKHPDPVAFMAPRANAATRPPSASPAPAAGSPVAAPASAPGQAASPLNLTVTSPEAGSTFRRGDPIALNIGANRDAHVYCYLQDENRQVVRFFPNRFQRDSLVKAGATLALPGSTRFQLFANKKGIDETIACFAAERDVMAELSQSIAGADFEPISGKSLDAIRGAFKQVTNSAFAEGYFQVRIR